MNRFLYGDSEYLLQKTVNALPQHPVPKSDSPAPLSSLKGDTQRGHKWNAENRVDIKQAEDLCKEGSPGLLQPQKLQEEGKKVEEETFKN